MGRFFLLLVALAGAIAVAAGCGSDDRSDSNRTSTPPETTTTTLAPSTEPSTSLPASSTSTEAESPNQAPAEGAPVAGGPCTTLQSIEVDPAGENLVCVLAGNDTPRWVNTGEIVGVNEPGEPCDSTVDQVSRTPDGLAIMCGGDTWTYGP